MTKQPNCIQIMQKDISDVQQELNNQAINLLSFTYSTDSSNST